MYLYTFVAPAATPGMQDLMADSFTDDTPGASQLAVASAPVHAVPLLDDPNDDFCRVCGFGVSVKTETPCYLPAVQLSVIHLHVCCQA